MRLKARIGGCLLLASCAGPAARADDWEYRVVDTVAFYGLESAAALSEVFLKGELLDHQIAAQNRWAADGWDFAPEMGKLGEHRLLLRRRASHREPFEVLLVTQKELAVASLEVAQDRINQLVRQGWALARSNDLWLEFHRSR